MKYRILIGVMLIFFVIIPCSSCKSVREESVIDQIHSDKEEEEIMEDTSVKDQVMEAVDSDHVAKDEIKEVIEVKVPKEEGNLLDENGLHEKLIPNEEDATKVISLKEYYKDYFTIGMGIEAWMLNREEYSSALNYHFDTMTMGNEMKPDYILDYENCIADLEKTNTNPAIHVRNLKLGLDYAKEHGLKLRGHTLIWHSQTPKWFFRENYSKDADTPLVSKEIMLQRMESYIRQIFEYINSNYPGIVYAYDVVNEGILPGDGDKDGYRVSDSLWYQTIGSEYIEKAFYYARKYAEEDVKLFYNDFNTYETSKRFAIYELCKKLKEANLIDGIGMQSHIKVDYPSLIDYEKTIEKFAELELEIHITELDMDMSEKTDEMLLKQATRYKRLFLLYRTMVEKERANISNVTFWGITDDTSWLNGTKASYPLLFDRKVKTKAAFYGVIQDDRIPLF